MAKRKGPTICAECAFYRATMKWGGGTLRNLCVATVKPERDLVSGETRDSWATDCHSRNDGRCKWYKEARDGKG